MQSACFCVVWGMKRFLYNLYRRITNRDMVRNVLIPVICVINHSVKGVFVKTHPLMYSYSGERPFSCDVCNNLFSANGSFKKHQLLQHGERPHLSEVIH
jgi:hypothetical protein